MWTIFAVLFLTSTAYAQNALQFPLLPVSSPSFLINGNWFGNGVYNFSSSTSPINDSSAGWMAFDKSNSTFWLSDYVYPNGSFVGSTETRAHRGEWIQISLPQQIALKSISLTCYANSGYLCPTEIAALGSQNADWIELATISPIFSVSNSTIIFPINKNEQLSMYRFIFKAADMKPGSLQIALADLRLFGVDCNPLSVLFESSSTLSTILNTLGSFFGQKQTCARISTKHWDSPSIFRLDKGFQRQILGFQ